MKILIALTLLAGSLQAMPTADTARQATTETIGDMNTVVLMSFVDQINLKLAQATAAGLYDTQITYGDTPYTIVFALAQKLTDKGYMVEINRATRTVAFNWGK
jgi:hypothetical protein